MVCLGRTSNHSSRKQSTLATCLRSRCLRAVVAQRIGAGIYGGGAINVVPPATSVWIAFSASVRSCGVML